MPAECSTFSPISVDDHLKAAAQAAARAFKGPVGTVFFDSSPAAGGGMEPVRLDFPSPALIGSVAAGPLKGKVDIDKAETNPLASLLGSYR